MAIFSVTEQQQQIAVIADPDAVKRRKGGKAPVATAAPGDVDAVAEGMRQAWAEDQAAKVSGIVTEGPGRPVTPSAPQPAEAFRQGYLAAGHSAPSPQHEPPRTNPLPELPPGVVQPVQLPGAPRAMNVSQAVAAMFCGGSPSER